MEIPLTLIDYLNRAELVYGDQIAVIDEPEQPAGPLSDLTYKGTRSICSQFCS